MQTLALKHQICRHLGIDSRQFKKLGLIPDAQLAGSKVRDLYDLNKALTHASRDGYPLHNQLLEAANRSIENEEAFKAVLTEAMRKLSDSK